MTKLEKSNSFEVQKGSPKDNAQILRGPFEKFMDSTYYSESELCGGAVTVSFSKYLTWQATHFLQRPTHFSKTCCRPRSTFSKLNAEVVSKSFRTEFNEINNNNKH
jgi:hypothetical protein